MVWDDLFLLCTSVTYGHVSTGFVATDMLELCIQWIILWNFVYVVAGEGAMVDESADCWRCGGRSSKRAMYVVASSTLGTLKIRQCAITVYTVTPTFDVAVLFINNACWDGVPFLMKASKALHTKRLDDFLSHITKYVSSDNQIEFGNSVDSY
jgi:hypothetical protein